MSRKGKIGVSFFITIVIILILAIIFVIFNRIIDRRLEEKYEELYLPAMQYLKSKYVEDMVINDEISYYDGVYTLKAYPSKNAELSFWIRYIESKNLFTDDYLVIFTEREANIMIENALRQYISNFECSAFIMSYPDIESNLYDYYTNKNRPMSWYDEDRLDEIEIWYILISLYGQTVSLEKTRIYNILDRIKDLPFTAEEIDFVYYSQENSKKPKERESVRYRLENNEYISN